MKYVDDFRDGEIARGLAAAITREIEPRTHAKWSPAGATH